VTGVPRKSAKAVIVRDEKLLVIVKRGAEGEYFVLPGGGQEHLESLPDALRRECYTPPWLTDHPLLKVLERNPGGDVGSGPSCS
jgi:hypothetical protein